MQKNNFYRILGVVVVVLIFCFGLIYLGANPNQPTNSATKQPATTSSSQAASSQTTDSSTAASSSSSSSVKKAKVSETQAQDIVLKAHPNSKIQGNERRQSSGRDYYIVYYVDSDGTAKAAYVDVTSGDILYERNADE